MASARVAVEHSFAAVRKWGYIDYFLQHKLFGTGVTNAVRTAFLLTNALTCLYGNQTVDRFDVEPPELEEYFMKPPPE